MSVSSRLADAARVFHISSSAGEALVENALSGPATHPIVVECPSDGRIAGRARRARIRLPHALGARAPVVGGRPRLALLADPAPAREIRPRSRPAHAKFLPHGLEVSAGRDYYGAIYGRCFGEPR